MQKPSWKNRRRVIMLSLAFCAGCILYIMIWSDPARTSVHEIIVMCAFGLAFSTIGSYVFGAVWDDKNHMSSISTKQEDTYGEFPSDPHGGV